MGLDKEVAIKILGWELLDRKEMKWLDGPVIYATNDEESPTFQGFTPSTNISHAMKVVAKMFKRGFRFKVEGKADDEWVVFFKPCSITESATTLPEAICKAALEAINQ